MTTSTPETPPSRRDARFAGTGSAYRGLLWQIVVVGIVVAHRRLAMVEHACTISSVRRISTGFAFLGREAGMPIADSLIAYSPRDTYLRALHRRHAQHAARRRHRHRARDHPRHAGRHRAAVEELAAVAACRGLCRSAAQHAAAAAAPVLVRADAGPAGGAQALEAGRRRLPFQSRPDPAVDSGRGRKPLGARRSRARAGRALSHPPAADRAADARRPRAPRLALALAADRRAAGAAVVAARRVLDDRVAGAARLQFRRRADAGAGIFRAADRARHLHLGLHRRDRARRHPGGVAADSGRRRRRSACAAASCCG